MRIAFASDERTHLTDHIGQELRSRGHQVELVGPPAGRRLPRAGVARAGVKRVSSAHADPRRGGNPEKLQGLEGEKGRV